MGINARQQKIIDFAKKEENFQKKDVFFAVRKEFDVDRMTIVRDLSFLTQENILVRTGKGRAVKYRLSKQLNLLRPVEVEKYFAKSLNDRKVMPFFNEDVFSALNDDIFTDKEINHLEKVNERYVQTRKRLEKDSPVILRKEWERLIVELSWKSSQIEGNTYTLLETEALIKEHQMAKGKEKADAQMIINHKSTLDFILENPTFFTVCEVNKIKKVHSFLVEGLGIKSDFRSHGVGIGGTLYRPLARQDEIAKVMKVLSETVKKINNPFSKAFVILVMLAYIQPFEDGNKRTARVVSNAILHAHDKSMLSYRDVDVVEYKKAVLLFYEQNNLSYIKKIFMEQFEFAVENYFG